MPENTNYKEAEEQKTKVIKGSAKLEKRSVKKRVVDFLFSDRLDSLGSFLLKTYLAPGIMGVLYNAGVGALGAIFAQRNGGAPVNTGGNYIPGYGYRPAQRDPYQYSAISSPSNVQPQPLYGYPQRTSLYDVSFDTQDDAWLVLNRMGREHQRYGFVRVSDFYTFAGVTGQEDNWTLGRSGWYSLGNAHPIQRTDGRWVIEFPPVQQLQ